MKLSKQIISFVLAAGMIFTSIPALAFDKPADAVESLQNGYSSSEDSYAIYPIPRSTEYLGNSFELGTNVQVVCENGIDTYTNAFLSEILANYDRTEIKAGTIGGKNQILLGIKGSGGAVDTWASANLTVENDSLFEQIDSYLLSAKDGTIVILGKDTDAVYYGLATLQMMFSSFNGSKFLNVQIEDYASMEMRGFIEGMYAIWDYDSRASLMRFARDYKMTTFMYASKSDSYHKNDTLYPNAEIEKIKELVEIGKETKVEYGWSIHLSYFWNASGTFDEKFDRLVAKFQQLYDAGVRNFAMLNDDFGGGDFSVIVDLLNKFDDEFIKTHEGCSNLIYCMKGYNEAWSEWEPYGNHGAELESLKNLNDSIYLYWTGAAVNSPITQETVDFLREKTDSHTPVIWVNYPVNEHCHSGLFLGPISHYARDDVTNLHGVVSNPSRFAEANKVALFQLAALFWNNHDYVSQVETIWEESFKYLQPEVYESYLTIARNVANCPGSDKVPQGFPESEYIKDELASVKTKIDRGQKISDDPNAQKIKTEFSNILTAISTFRKDCKNQNLIEEITPWLNSLNDVATAGEAAMDALFAMEKGDLAGAWEGLGAAGEAMDTYNTYPSYSGSTNMAAAGSKRLVPFVQSAVIAAKNQIIPFLNPGSTEFTPSVYAVMGGTSRDNDSNSAKIFDGNETTYASYETVQKVNDYFGIDMGRTIPVSSIDILQAKEDSHHDYFHNADLEYSTDGENWTTLESYENDSAPVHIIKEDLDIKARYIRLRLTKEGTSNKPDYYTYIREITINGHLQTASKYGLYASETVSAQVVREKLTYSIDSEEAISLAAGEYIGIKLEELSGLNSVTADSASGLTLQYSENGIVWEEMPGNPDGVAARYVRLYNGTNQSVTLPSVNFSVSVYSSTLEPAVIDYNPEFSTLNTNNKSGTWEEALFDGIKDGTDYTYIWTNTPQATGQYIIVDLGKEAPIYDLTITQKDGLPIFYNAAFYLSTENGNWGEPITTTTYDGTNVTGEHRSVSNGYIEIKRDDLDGRLARYLKIEVTGAGASGRYLRIDEIEFNQSVPKAQNPVNQLTSDTLTGNLNKIIDGNFATVYRASQPSDGTAALTYRLTENTNLTSITFLQNSKEITNAVVKATILNGTKTEEKTLGTLNAASNSFYLKGDAHVLSITVTWPKGTTPCLYEIITNTGETVHTITFMNDGAQITSEICLEGRAITLPNNTVSKEGYTFQGWSDGSTTYEAGTSYTMGASDVTLTAVWAKNSTPPPTPPVGDTIQVNKIYTYGDLDYRVTSLTAATVEVAAQKNTALTKIVVPDTIILDKKTYKVTSVAASAFKNFKKATTATIGKNVETIGDGAFAGCAKLKKVTIKSTTLTSVGRKAFQKCKALKNIIIKSKSLKTVGKNAFKGIHKKAAIKVPAAKYKNYVKILSKKGQAKTVKIKK